MRDSIGIVDLVARPVRVCQKTGRCNNRATRTNPDETRRFGGGSLDMISGRSGFGDLEGWRWVSFLLSGLTIDDCNLKKIED